MRPEFEDLLFFERPDLTPYLIHLTKNTKADDDYSAYNNLVNILLTGKIWGSEKRATIHQGSPLRCLLHGCALLLFEIYAECGKQRPD